MKWLWKSVDMISSWSIFIFPLKLLGPRFGNFYSFLVLDNFVCGEVPVEFGTVARRCLEEPLPHSLNAIDKVVHLILNLLLLTLAFLLKLSVLEWKVFIERSPFLAYWAPLEIDDLVDQWLNSLVSCFVERTQLFAVRFLTLNWVHWRMKFLELLFTQMVF